MQIAVYAFVILSYKQGNNYKMKGRRSIALSFLCEKAWLGYCLKIAVELHATCHQLQFNPVVETTPLRLKHKTTTSTLLQRWNLNKALLIFVMSNYSYLIMNSFDNYNWKL